MTTSSSDSAAPGLAATDLHAAGVALEQAAAAAREWVRGTQANASRVRMESADLVATALHTQNEARKLANAARRRMCTGVFGPSQAGKSYLVSRLAKRTASVEDGESDTPLLVELGDDVLDFISKINPAGDKESTGLVTRFTTEALVTPAGFPVSLRLLTEADLVRIFANSYFLDFDHHNLEFEAPRDGEAIRAIVEPALAATRGTPLAHLDEVALYDLRQYFRRNFRSSSGFLDDSGYWELLGTAVAELPLAARAQAFSVLWGGIEVFTELYQLLVAGLEALGFAGEACAALAALDPREQSIIDVDRVKHSLNTPEDATDLVEVVAEGGKPVALARATLCALVSELKLRVRSETWPMFVHTDLLDFPGARSREICRALPERGDTPEQAAARPRELFIRGKVAMLFQRYSEERELTSMLLCMGPSNAEVKDLGPLVREWIASTHGDSPAERALQANAMFLVLTKSDDDFKSKAGDDDTSLRAKWQRRIDASMLSPYKADGWVDAWQDKDGREEPFRNVLWLRNPGVQQAHLVAYETRDGQRVESGYAADIEAQLPALRQYFLDDEVARYFSDPPAAFDALLSLNDGGVSYLASRLAPVCDPATKAEQVSARLRSTAERFAQRFERFFEAGDEANRDDKRNEAMAAVESLGRALAQTKFRSFGALLGELQADPERLYGIYLAIAQSDTEHLAGANGALPTKGTDEAVGNARSVFDFGANEDEDDDDDDVPATPSGTPASGRMASSEADGDPRLSLFGQRATAQWIAGVRERTPHAVDTSTDDALADAHAFMVDQVISAAQRHDLPATISGQLQARAQSVSNSWEDMAQLASVVGAGTINTLVTTLGYADAPVDERPPVPPAPAPMKRRAFAPMEADEDALPILGKRRRSVERDYAQDWLAAMVQLAMDNIGFSTGREITDEQNAALGQLLAMVASARASERAA